MIKNEKQAHARNPFDNVPKCGAHSRRTGMPCRQPAMTNGRCRLHGGKSTGAPKGNQNALKHGAYTEEVKARNRQIREVIKMCKESFSVLETP